MAQVSSRSSARSVNLRSVACFYAFGCWINRRKRFPATLAY